MGQKAITGVILAGGQGSRMGCQDKGLLLLKGKPLAAWAIERLLPQTQALLINANRNQEVYAAIGAPFSVKQVSDRISGFHGPLAGLHAAAFYAQTPLIASVACDTPFFPLDLVKRLLEGLEAEQSDLSVARTATGLEPVFCLYRQSLLASLEGCLAKGCHKVSDWHRGLRISEVFFENETDFFNLNTKEDLCLAKARFR